MQSQSFRQVLNSRGRGLSEAEAKAVLEQVLQQLLPFHQYGQAYGNISLDTLRQDVQTGEVSLTSIGKSLAHPKDDIYQLVTTLVELLTRQPAEKLLQSDGSWRWQDECLVSDQFAILIEGVISPGEIQFANAMEMLDAMHSPRRSQPVATTLSFAPGVPEAAVMLKIRLPQVGQFSSAPAAEKPAWFWFAVGSGAVAILGIGITVMLKQNDQVASSVASSAPTEVSSPDATPSSEPVPVETNPFDQARFPQNVCGDPLPTNSSAYPVSFYPVFVSLSDTNLQISKSRFCRDALPVVRKDTNVKAIQVASFRSLERANFFREYVSRGISDAEVGASTIVQKAP
jgi:hypothetical protein